MPSPLDDEIRGDWNNLKGTEYHLVYVIWLLLYHDVRSVAFYQGNDLLAKPISPLAPQEAQTLVPAIRAQLLDEDEWIQLKATRDPWTPTALFEENLLLNFICNALTSEAAGRTWRTRLVTQGEIRRAAIEGFVEHPERFPELYDKLERTLTNAQDRLQQNGWQPVDRARLQTLALTILKQLAQEEPFPLAQLKDKVDLHLAYLYHNPVAVLQVGNTLLGALLRDAAGGPSTAHDYDDAWLDQIAGASLKPRLLFDTDPLSACDQAVQAIYDVPSIHWEVRRCVLRVRIEQELHYFLQASETVFVLLGMSGTGKSWAVSDWMGRTLQGCARLLISGSELDHDDQRGLSHLVAQHLRRFTSAPISDEDVLSKLLSVARAMGKGPLVLVIDDLQPIGETRVFRRDLRRIVDQCRVAGIKLVLTAQTHVWDFYRLGQEIPSGDIYQPEPRTPQRGAGGENSVTLQSSSSFTLSDFTPEEQETVLQQRLTLREAQHMGRLLQTSVFAPLRRPYLLERYLEQYSERFQLLGTELVPVDIDALLDWRLNELLVRVATSVNADEKDVTDAFNALQHLLWLARPNGLSYAAVEASLKPFLGDQSGQALAELRQVGIVTARGGVRFADTPLAERIFAHALSKSFFVENGGEKNTLVHQLRLEDDTGVVSALLRSLAHDHSITLAETLLKRDVRWSTAIGEGLAQGFSQEYQVLAFLTVLTHSQEEVCKIAGCTALGQLAAGGYRKRASIPCQQRAFEWVTQLYLSAHSTNRLNGSRAFSITLDLAPERVERAIRLRLSRRLRSQQADEWLRDALMPLLNITHARAALVGKRLLAHYTTITRQESFALNKQLSREADEAWGSIALFEHNEMERIRVDLHSQKTDVRIHAAAALRCIMFEQPESIQTDICEAIRNESDWHVMNQILWATYRLTELVPDRLLDAFSESFALEWSIPSPSAGIAFATLSNLARQRPERVVPLLPERLDTFDVVQQSWLREGLAFAWWVCAEHAPKSHEVLASLAAPDLSAVSAELQIFTLRGAVIAQLGLMSMGTVSMGELHGQQIPYPGVDMQFFIVNTVDFAHKHATTLLAQPGADHLLALLVRCLSEESRARVHPVAKVLFRAHNFCTSLSMDLFISLLAVHPNPVPLLQRLPRNWRVVDATRRLLEQGRREVSVLSFAHELCNVPVSGSDVQELGEREELLALMVGLSEAPAAALQELRATFPASPFTASHRANAFTGLADANLGVKLDLLAQNLTCEEDLTALYQWVEQASSWQGLLVAKVYARMFDASPVSRVEAYELCEQMLAAVRKLPTSELQQDYLTVYETIAHWIATGPSSLQVPSLKDTREHVLNRSHAFALDLLHQASSQWKDKQAQQTWLVDTLAAAYDKGWWKNEGVILKEGRASISTSHELVYVFPAVRLALVAIATTTKQSTEEPAARFFAQRVAVNTLLNEYRWQVDSSDPMILNTVLTALERSGDAVRRDERVQQLHGVLLIKISRLSEAEEEMEQCLSIPSCTDSTRTFAWYNLACIYALTGREELCRTTLSKAIELGPMLRQQIVGDQDFVLVRSSSWFQALLPTENA